MQITDVRHRIHTEIMRIKPFHIVIFSLATTIFVGVAANVFYEETRVERAARSVVSEIRFARHFAVKHKRFTAVLMPTAQDSHHGGVSNARFKSCAFRVVVLEGYPEFELNERNLQGQFASYIEDQPWIFLPEGTYIGYTDTNGEYEYGDPITTYCNVVDNVPFPDSLSTLSINNIRAIIFTPQGNAVSSAQGGNPGTEDTHVVILPGPVTNGTGLRGFDNDEKSINVTISHLSGELTFN